MHHQVLVGVMHGGADLLEQPNPLLNPEPVAVAVPVDGNTIHELHHAVEPSILHDPAVQEASDVGMMEGGQDLSFLLEASGLLRGGDAVPEELQGDPLPEFAIGSLRQVHGPHSPSAQDFQQPVVPDDHACRFRGRILWSQLQLR